MYEKFRTEVQHIINDRLYFNDKYFVEKTIISTYVYHPLLKKLIQYKFHFAELKEEGFAYKVKVITDNCFDPDDFLFDDTEYDIKKNGEVDENLLYRVYLKDRIEECKKVKGNLLGITENKDLTEELNKYCPDPAKQNVYLFNETWYRGEKLPIYYSLTYAGVYWDLWIFSINEINLRTFIDEYQNKIENLIKQQKLKPDFILNGYFFYLHFLGDKINYYLNEGRFQTKFFRNCEKALSKTADLALYYFIKDVLNTFLDHASEKKAFSRCQYCGQIMKYVEGKKYCSLSVDGQDCGKSARDKKYYLKRKTK
jgi:hypothetical protein